LVEITSERIASSVARAAGVADHLGIAFGKAGVFGGVEPGVHAGEDGETPRGRHGELALVAETGGISLVGGEHFLQDRSHGESSLEKLSVAVGYYASKLQKKR
jgi:hypothetical protein